MDDGAERDKAAAHDSEQQLLAPMAVAITLGLVRLPRGGSHPGGRHRLHDRGIRDAAGCVQDRHAPVEYVEGKIVLVTDDRSDRASQDRDLLSTVHAAHLEGAAAAQRGCGAELLFPGTARICLVIVTVVVVMTVLVSMIVVVLVIVRMRVGHRPLRPPSVECSVIR